MAYIRDIRQNTIDSHQSSPGYVLTFLRWSNRDTFNYKNNGGPLEVREPLVVINDALQVSIGQKKNNPNHTCSMVLKNGSLNYPSAIHPGDFVIVNLLDWEEDVDRVAEKARLRKPINDLADGFKGVYKIQSVVKSIAVSGNGAKTTTTTVTAVAFTELQNYIYYNPAIAAAFADRGTNLWATAIGEYYQDLLKTESSVQTILKALFKIFLGKSNKDFDSKIKNYGNTHFKIPTTLGDLLGVKNAKYVNEVYNYVLGVWKASKNLNANESNIGVGFNPSVNQESEGNFYNTGLTLQGNKEVSLENWNNNTAWSILQGYLNSVMNEMYTTFRVTPENKIMPTIVVRQKPFTNRHFKVPNGFPVTQYLELPRWNISPNLILDIQLAKNEAARYNFVQVFTRSLSDIAEMDMAQQIELGNFVEDREDIQRNGLKPYVVTSNFDFPTQSNKRIRAKEWSQIVSDWVLNGHLKTSGKIKLVGIQDPISVGDNIQLDNVVLHIEGVQHTLTMANDKKIFRTVLTVSQGLDDRSSVSGPVYPDMDNPNAVTNLIQDYENERLLPGISDTQDVFGRTEGEQFKIPASSSFTQANLRKTKPKVTSNTGEEPNPGKTDGGQSIGSRKKR